MKKKYVTPITVVVKINLVGSVLESVNVNNGSVRGMWEDGAKKNHSLNDEEEETPVGTVDGDKSVWDD